MTFYYPFPVFGKVVWEYGAAEICVDVTGNIKYFLSHRHKF